MKLSAPLRPTRILSLVLLPLLVVMLAAPAGGQEPTTQPTEEELHEQILALDATKEHMKDELAHLRSALEAERAEVKGVEDQVEALTRRVESARAQLGNEHQEVTRTQENRDRVLDRLHQARVDLEVLQQRLDTKAAELANLPQRRAQLQRQLLDAAAEESQRDLLELRPPNGDRAQLELQIHQAEIRKREAEYTGLRKQLATMQGLHELGRAGGEEIARLQTQLAVALAELEKAQAEFALRQLEDERGGFDQRNAADSTAAAMQTEFFRGYLDAVERYAQLSSNPKNAGVAAVVTAADMLRDQPPQATIDFFAPLLEAGQFPDYTVETAVRLQLAEAYRAADQTEQALQTLRALIVASE